ncbi:hypothetical protein CsatB_001070 [Cannabis sativa]
MDIGGSSDQVYSDKSSRRTWSKFEEDALLNVLEEVLVKGGNRCDNGTVRPGTWKEIEKALNVLIPSSGIRASPHIENKYRMLKKQYSIVFDMVNTSGFSWNDVKKCVQVDSDEAWLTYTQNIKDAKGWRNKPFPMYERLANIFGKDRATGKGAEAPADMVENMNLEAEEETDDSRSVNQNLSSPRGRRKRSRSDDDGMKEIASTFKTMFEHSIEQMRLMVQGTTNDKELAKELKSMGLSVDDQLDVLTYMLKKPEYVATFKSIDGEIREAFVTRVLREVRSSR